MQTQTLISMIIPVYNVEGHIRKCLDSVLSQTYQNLQIILVDDGSTDTSGDICEEYKRKDNRITVLHKKNQGVSEARNSGLQAAKGTYVCFADSDDYLKEDMVETLFSNIKNADAQLSICGFYEVMEGKLIERTTGSKVELSNEQAMEELLDIHSFKGYLWNKMFCMDQIRDLKLSFQREIYAWEDVLFIAQYIMHCKTIVYDPGQYYYYVYHTNSISHQKGLMYKSYSVVKAQDIINGFLPAEFGKARTILAMRVLESVMDVYRASCTDDNNDKKKYYRLCKAQIKKYKKLGYTGMRKKSRITMHICSISPKLYCLIYNAAH